MTSVIGEKFVFSKFLEPVSEEVANNELAEIEAWLEADDVKQAEKATATDANQNDSNQNNTNNNSDQNSTNNECGKTCKESVEEKVARLQAELEAVQAELASERMNDTKKNNK